MDDERIRESGFTISQASIIRTLSDDEILEMFKKVRDAAIEQCCRVVCIDCANTALWGAAVEDNGYWLHRSTSGAAELPCKAAAIRSRVAAQGEK